MSFFLPEQCRACVGITTLRFSESPFRNWGCYHVATWILTCTVGMQGMTNEGIHPSVHLLFVSPVVRSCAQLEEGAGPHVQQAQGLWVLRVRERGGGAASTAAAQQIRPRRTTPRGTPPPISHVVSDVISVVSDVISVVSDVICDIIGDIIGDIISDIISFVIVDTSDDLPFSPLPPPPPPPLFPSSM